MQKSRIITACASLAMAGAIGFAMQYGQGESLSAMSKPVTASASVSVPSRTPSKPADAKPVEKMTATRVGDDTLTEPLVLDDIAETSASAAQSVKPSTPSVSPERTDPANFAPQSAKNAAPTEGGTAGLAAPQMQCEAQMDATLQDAAIVALRFTAPCMPAEKVTMHHNGMMFTAYTDDAGALELNVPALSTQAVFIAALDNGEGAVSVIAVPDLTQYSRAVLQWQGPHGFEIHALEYGAGYGDTGHIWAQSQGDQARALDGTSGFVTLLGEGDISLAHRAEVYTFPSGTAQTAGDIALSVETEVTAANCGQEVAAQTIEMMPDGKPLVQDLILAVPECDAVGDFLVLKNILQDLKIAAN